MKSAAENADVVEEYLFTEQSAGRVTGPLAPETVPFVADQCIWSNSKKWARKMAPNCRSFIARGSKCEWWHQQRVVFSLLCTCGWHCTSHPEVGVGYLTGQVGYSGSIHVPYGACSPRWPPVVGNGMEREYLHWYNSAIWVAICPQDFSSIADALEWVMQTRGVHHYLDD